MEDNIRTCLKEMWWEIVDWIHLAQDRDQWLALVNTVGNYSTSLATICFSRRTSFRIVIVMYVQYETNLDIVGMELCLSVL